MSAIQQWRAAIGHWDKRTSSQRSKLRHAHQFLFSKASIMLLCVLVQVHLRKLPQETVPMMWHCLKEGKTLNVLCHQRKRNEICQGKTHNRCRWLSLLVTIHIIQMLLFMSGDVELNPGPLFGELGLDDLCTVHEAIFSVRHKWYSVGVEMRIDTGTLDALKVQFNNRPEDCLLEMLKHWLSQIPHHTWKDLVDLLSSLPVGEETLAAKIEEQYCQSKDRNDGRLCGVNLPDVRSTLYPMREKWYLLGIELKMDMGTMNSIRTQYQNDPSDCLLQMLKEWLNHSSPFPTWEALVISLTSEHIGETELAQTIMEKHCPHLQETVLKSKAGFGSATTSGIISEYSAYLKQMYNRFRLPLESQWPPVRSERFVPLALSLQDGPHMEQSIRSVVKQAMSGEVDHKVKGTNSVELGQILSPQHPDQQVKTVLMEGAPGIGKTAISITICKEWTSGRLFQNFKILLLWSLKDPILHAFKSLDELFFHDSEEVTQSVARIVKKEGGRGVLFVLDGWDELPQRISRNRHFFLLELIRGKKLPFSSVIVTTRPIQSQYLLQASMFDRRIEVCGFSHSSIIQYIERCFEHQPQTATRLQKSLEQRPDIETICYIPMNCAIVSYVYAQLSKLPATLTQFYSYLTLNSLLRNIQLRGEAEEIQLTQIQNLTELPEEMGKLYMALCELAFRGLWVNMYTYSRKDIAAICRSTPRIVANIDNLGILQAINVFHPTGVEVSFHFLHSTLQEFMAAQYLANLDVTEQMYYIEKYLSYFSFSMVWQFYCGITAEKTLVQVNMIPVFEKKVEEITWWDTEEAGPLSPSTSYENLSTDDDEGDSGGGSILAPTGSLTLGTAQSHQPSSTCQNLGLAEHVPPSTSISVEVPNLEATKDVIGSQEPSLVNTEPLTPAEPGIRQTSLVPRTTEVHSVLGPTDSLTPETAHSHQPSPKCQSPALEECLPPSTSISLEVPTLEATGDVVGSREPQDLGYLSGVKPQISKATSELAFKSTPSMLDRRDKRELLFILKCLYESQNQTICSRIAKCCHNQLIFRFALSATDTNALGYLVSKSKKSWRLHFKGCNLGVEHIRTLQHQIRLNKCHDKIQALTVCNNPMDTPFIQELSKIAPAQKTLCELHLRANKLNDANAQLLASLISQTVSLTCVDLSDNEITDKGMHFVCRSFSMCSNLTEIDLSDNRLKEATAENLAHVMTCLGTIQHLDLGTNQIGDRGTEFICSALPGDHSLKYLNLSNNDISPEGAAYIATAISDHMCIETLVLHSNAIGTGGADLIFSALSSNHSLRRLAMCECDIDYNLQLQMTLHCALLEAKSLQKLELAFNNLGSDGVSTIIKVIQTGSTNITHLSIADNGISPEVLVELGEMLIDTRLCHISLTASELCFDSEITDTFMQFLTWTNELRSIDVYEVGSEKQELKEYFKAINTDRKNNGLKKILTTYYSVDEQ